MQPAAYNILNTLITLYARQGRWRLVVAASMSLAISTFYLIWKSNMPAQTKSAPFSKAYLKPSRGWIAPAAIPMMMGMLPTPAGIMLSAPMVRDLGDHVGVGRNRLAAINFLFRHQWEPVWPAVFW